MIKKKEAIEQIRKRIEVNLQEKVDQFGELKTDLLSSLDNALSELLTVFDNLVKDIALLERRKDSLEAHVKEFDDRKRTIEKKEQELADIRKRLSEKEALIEEERELIEKKKKHIAGLEHDVQKRKQLIDERTKNYKVATPIKS